MKIVFILLDVFRVCLVIDLVELIVNFFVWFLKIVLIVCVLYLLLYGVFVLWVLI